LQISKKVAATKDNNPLPNSPYTSGGSQNRSTGRHTPPPFLYPFYLDIDELVLALNIAEYCSLDFTQFFINQKK
jgi:hypothetical protein